MAIASSATRDPPKCAGHYGRAAKRNHCDVGRFDLVVLIASAPALGSRCRNRR
jgi:hypothetical protein